MTAAESWEWCINGSNMFRTNTDIVPSWGRVMEELESMVGLAQISRPGAWAFPDALEVGVPGGMTWEETKSHVALWAITSSPLFLANDVREGYMQQRLVVGPAPVGPGQQHTHSAAQPPAGAQQGLTDPATVAEL